MVRFRGKSQGATSHAIRLGGALLSPQAHCHVCAFFNNPDEECRVLLPLIREGIESGEKAFHTVDPQRYEAHLQRLASAGIDVTATLQSGQFELRPWTDVHLRDGQFDQTKTLAYFEEVV